MEQRTRIVALLPPPPFREHRLWPILPCPVKRTNPSAARPLPANATDPASRSSSRILTIATAFDRHLPPRARYLAGSILQRDVHAAAIRNAVVLFIGVRSGSLVYAAIPEIAFFRFDLGEARGKRLVASDMAESTNDLTSGATFTAPSDIRLSSGLVASAIALLTYDLTSGATFICASDTCFASGAVASVTACSTSCLTPTIWCSRSLTGR